MNIKDAWIRVSSQLIDKNVRQKSFVFLSTFIFTFVALGCVIVNFITNEKTLAIVSSVVFGLLLFLEITEIIFFSKYKKVKSYFFSVPLYLLLSVLALVYLYVGPFDALYLFWICIIPITICLSVGLVSGIISSSILIVIVLCTFFIPGLSDLTRSNTSDNQWLTKAFFLVYYLMCSFIGVALAFFNNSIINQLDKLKDVYYEDANTDNLTGLRNQAYYLSYVNKLKEIVKEGETIGLMFIDVDDFKIYNDKYGHSVGNEVLINVANKLNEVPHALICRWGGDEFTIVERNLTRDEFIAKANYLLKSVEGLSYGVTISIGLAYYLVDNNFNFQKIFNEADMQAIRAKGKGKNCIIINEKK